MDCNSDEIKKAEEKGECNVIKFITFVILYIILLFFLTTGIGFFSSAFNLLEVNSLKYCPNCSYELRC